MSKLSRHKRPLIETLEPRLLFSATADIAVFDDGSADITQLSEAAAKLDLTAIYLPPADPLLDAQTAAQRITSLVVVDTAVENYKQLVEDIRQQHSTGDLEIVYLDANSDGVFQIAQQLTQFSRLDSLHIISHGANGSVALGSTLLSTNNLFQYEDELIAWRTALGENADILIYGCDVAATVQGREFIAELAALTDADVAASDDATGHNTLNGDWDLEFSVGSIEQTVVVSTAVQEAWVGVLASTHYINIQGGASVQSVSSVSGVGQSFLYDSPGATYTVNQISVQLRVESGAANQDITIQLLDGGWNDASPLATQTINSDQLDSTFGWKTFNFGDVVLNDNQTYIIKITTNNADGKVSVAYKSDAWNNSEMIVNGTGNSSADLNFLLSYNNGSNQAPVNTVPGAQSTNQNTPLIFSSIYGNQIQVADADAFPNDLEVTLNAAQGSFSLAQTTGLTFIGGDGTNDFYMLFRGSVAEINAALSTITYTPVNNFFGGDTFSITTKDLGLSGGLQDTDNIAITINNVNDAPTVVIAETSYAVDEQALLDLHGTGIVINDSDGDTLTVTVEAPSTYSQLTALVGTTGVIISSGNATNVLTLTGTSTQLNNLFAGNNGGTLTYRLAGDTPSATQQLTISASDGSLSANDSALINITAINDPVTLANPIVNQIATEESLFSFTFAADTFADVDGDLLTYTATLANGDALPAWLHFNAGTRTFSGVPDDGDVGFISVKVTANDGNGSTADDTFDITINGVNDDPFVNTPVPNQNATEDSVFTYIFPANTFGDGDVGATFSYTAELADGGALPAWLNFDSATRTFSGTPTNSDVGTISVKLIANDGAGGTANDVFDVVIANTNDAPTVANPIGNQTATESALFNYTFPINAFSDQDLGESLTYSATLAGGGALPGWLSFDSATRTFSGTPSNGDVGTISISVTADDGEATVSDTFDVVIGNVDNSPFLITPIPNQNATEDAAFNFQFDNATFDDPDVGDTLTYTATMADGSALPAWLSFDAVTRTFSGTPANADVGTISIRVTADDGNGGAPATDTFDLVVANTNDAPTVANPIPNANATEDAAFNFTFAANTFADQDVGNALTYSAQTGGGGALPAWLNFDGATRTFSGTPTNAHVGTISIDVIANDGNGGTVTDTFSITVANTNDAPILANAIPNQNATEDSAFNFQFNSNTFSDVDVSDTLTYSAQLAGGSALPAWLSFDPVTRTFSGTPLNAHVGTVSIEVIADDGNGGSVTDTFTITVANTNDAPSVTITATDYFADEQTPIDLHGTGISVADVDGDALTITLTAEGSNSNLAATVGTTGVVIVSGVNTNTLVLTGTAAQLNDLFAGNGGSTLTYRLSGDTPVATRMLTISANDGSLSGSDTATINITALNDAPENTVPGGQVTSEDTSLVFSSVNGNRIQIDDLDVGAGNLQVTLSVTNGTLTLDGTTGLIFTTGDGTNDSSLVFSGTKTDINNALSILTFNPTTGYNGTAVLAITTSDLGNSGSGGVLIDSDTVNITITAVNDAPTVANTIPNQNTAEDSTFNFQFNINTFADSDVGDTLTYTAQLAGGGALPAWLSFDPVTRTFSGTPANGDVGTVSIDVITNDGNGGTATDTFNIVVANTNDAPIVANPISNQNAAEDSAFNFQFNSNTFSDVDVGDTLTYTAQLAGGGALPAWLSFDPVTRTFSGTPANGDVGTVSIDVIADDGNGGTVTDTFNIVVANTNDAPTVANPISNQNATEDSAFNFQFNSNTFGDADVGDTLTYIAQLAGGGTLPAWLSFDPVTRTFSGTPANGDVGTVSIDVIADDGNGGTVTDAFNIVVANTNDAPIVANVIPDQNATEDSAFNFQFNSNIFADSDIGDTLTYTAQLAGGGALPAWLSFDPVTRTFSGTPVNGDIGTVSIDVIADDGNGGTVTDAFNIVVANTNDAPIVANVIPDQNATEDSAFNFQFNSNIFADSDVGDTLTYTAQLAGGGALPAWLSFDPVTRTFSGTPVNGDIGTVSIDVIADDGNGGTVTDTFNIVVANTNDAPIVANVIPDQNATEDSAFNFQFNNNTFSDIDVGDTLTYTAQIAGGGALPAWLSFDPVTRTFSGTPANGDVGTVSIDVIADDSNGGTVTDTFNIVVANTNDAPAVANVIPDQNATEDSAFNFQFNSNTFADSDVGDTLTYTAQLAGGGALPAWLNFDPVTRTFSGTPVNGDIGTVSIDVIADDGNGGTVTDTFNIVVANTNDAPAVANVIPDQNATEDSAFNFQFNSNTFADSDVGDTLTYTAQLAGGGALPAWLNFDPATRTFSGTPTNGDVGAILIDVIANDGNSAATDTFMIAVVNVNDAPTAITIDNMTMVAGDAPQQIDLRNKFFDIEDVVTLNFELMGNSNPDAVIDVQMDQNTGMMTIVVSSENAGESIIRLRAIDSDGAWVESSFKVTVSAKEPPVAPPVIIPPVIVAPPIITPDVDETTPPTIPDPIIPPVVVLPETQNPGVIPPTHGDESTLSPALPDEPDITSEGVDQELLVNGDEYDSPYNVVEDKSAQDYERVVQLLNSNALQVSSLTASTSLVSLIVPDAGFAPWEAAEFDSEVRRIRAQMDEALEEEHDRKALIAGISFSLTTGLLIWSLRASSLLLAMVSMLPLWRGLDPLPILDEVNKRKKELEQQRKDRKHEDKNAKEVGYLFDHAQQKTKDV